MMREKLHQSLLLLTVSAQNRHKTIAWLSVTLGIDFLVIYLKWGTVLAGPYTVQASYFITYSKVWIPQLSWTLQISALKPQIQGFLIYITQVRQQPRMISRKLNLYVL